MSGIAKLRLSLILLGAVIAFGTWWTLRPPEEPPPRPPSEADLLAEQMQQDTYAYLESGGDLKNLNDPKHPAKKWAPVLWQHFLDHSDSIEGHRALSHALALLRRSDAVSELYSKAASLDPDDKVWHTVLYLLRTYTPEGDLAKFESLAESVFRRTHDATLRMESGIHAAWALSQQGKTAKAREVVETVLAETPDELKSKHARWLWRELSRLDLGLETPDIPGMPEFPRTPDLGAEAPDFSVRALDGSTVSLAGLRGKVVLLDFWATWCVPCLPDIAKFQRLLAKYEAEGFAIVGVSADTDRKALETMVDERRIRWPQLFDDDGTGGGIVGLYNVYGYPSYFLLDCEGRVAAQTNSSSPGLREKGVMEKTVSRLLRECVTTTE